MTIKKLPFSKASVEQMREATYEVASALVQRAHRTHIFTLEAMIQRYQRDLWRTCIAYQSKLSVSVGNSGHFTHVIDALTNDLNSIGQRYIEKAANLGYARGVEALYLSKWIVRYDSPIIAPHAIVASAIAENHAYLTKSLGVDLKTAMADVDKPELLPAALASFRARIRLYGHYLWRVSERSYKACMQEFDTFHKRARSLREGGAGSGNWDHAGRIGLVGGSAAASGTIKAMRKVAQMHDEAKDEPNNPKTKAAYGAFVTQVNQQYEDLVKQGYRFEFGSDDPYKDSQEMTKDVDENKRLKVYNVVDLPEGHPLAAMSPYDNQTENTIFRAVHDMYGHYFPGNTFGQRGELKAYQAHGAMFDDAALPALASETLAQNAWVNHAESNEDLPVQDRPFAPQKSYAFDLGVARAVRDSKFPRIKLTEAEDDGTSEFIDLDFDELDHTDFRHGRCA